MGFREGIEAANLARSSSRLTLLLLLLPPGMAEELEEAILAADDASLLFLETPTYTCLIFAFLGGQLVFFLLPSCPVALRLSSCPGRPYGYMDIHGRGFRQKQLSGYVV